MGGIGGGSKESRPESGCGDGGEGISIMSQVEREGGWLCARNSLFLVQGGWGEGPHSPSVVGDHWPSASS